MNEKFLYFLFAVKVFLTKTQEKKIKKNIVNDITRDETQEIKKKLRKNSTKKTIWCCLYRRRNKKPNPNKVQ